VTISSRKRQLLLHYPHGTLLNEIYTGWRWPHVVDKIEHRPLDYPKIWRIAQAKTRKPVKFGTRCSQAMAIFLDIHTAHYKDKRQLIWDMAEAMNKELLALRGAGCRCIQTEEPTFHFMANTYGKDHSEVKFMIEAFNREVQGLDDVELWIHTCWGNPNMQRVMEDTSYANSIEIYLERCCGDVWTLEMRDRNQKDLELLEPFRYDLKKKIAIGVVSHRTLQADRAEAVAEEIRKALKHIAPDPLIVSSDCGFGRQGANREIAFYKASAIAQGANMVRRELGVPTTYVPAADPKLQMDIVPGRNDAGEADG
jgi:5-methyltetrahydropteroyltriglutamate--homocysteine methyltransferase